MCRITRKSLLTGNMNTMELNCDYHPLFAFWSGVDSRPIHMILPNLTPEEVEFILTGVTPDEINNQTMEKQCLER